MKRVAIVFTAFVVLAAVHCGSAPGTERAPEELRSFGIAFVERGAPTRLVDDAGNERGAVTVAADGAHVVWKGSELALRWSDASLSVLENDREIGRADPSGPQADSIEAFRSRIEPILVAGMVAREQGASVPWLPSVQQGADIHTKLAEESGDCHSASCSAWSQSTAYNCAIGAAYSQCDISGGGCTRDGTSCSCGWLSCTCTATFCHEWLQAY